MIGYDPAEDNRKNYFVSQSGMTVVTRDYFSIYENPGLTGVSQ